MNALSLHGHFPLLSKLTTTHYNTLKFKHNSSIFYMPHLAFVNSNNDII